MPPPITLTTDFGPASPYVAAMKGAVKLPVTVKMRSGYEDISLFKENLSAAQESGVRYITLHPRTKADGYGPPARWDLIAEAKSLLGTDPAAPAALALASRWKELTAALTGGNQDVKEKLRNIQQDAWADPQTAQTFPVTPGVWEFIRTAVAKLEEQKY